MPISPFVLALLQLVQFMPGIIQTVEALHGPGKGKDKLASAVQLVTAVEPTLAQAIGTDPAKQAHVEQVISAVVGVMNVTGMMGKPVSITPAADPG